MLSAQPRVCTSGSHLCSSPNCGGNSLDLHWWELGNISCSYIWTQISWTLQSAVVWVFGRFFVGFFKRIISLCLYCQIRDKIQSPHQITIILPWFKYCNVFLLHAFSFLIHPIFFLWAGYLCYLNIYFKNM